MSRESAEFVSNVKKRNREEEENATLESELTPVKKKQRLNSADRKRMAKKRYFDNDLT